MSKIPKIDRIEGMITYDDGNTATFTVMHTETTGVFFRQYRGDQEVNGRGVFVLESLVEAVNRQRNGEEPDQPGGSDLDTDDEDEPPLHSDEDGPGEFYQVHVDPVRFAQFGPDCTGSNAYVGKSSEAATCKECGQLVKVSSGGYLLIHTRPKS